MVVSHRRRDIAWATGLAGVAGFVDAVGFISVGGFFVSFMSGNTTRASVALSEGAFLQFGLALGLIAAFLAGVVTGTIVGDRVKKSVRRVAVLVLVAALLASAGVVHSFPAVTALAAPIIAAAMGAENAVFEKDGEVSIGLTYMTGTLVKLGQHLAARMQGRPTTAWMRYLALWGALAAGGIMGGFCYRWFGFESIWIAVGAVMVAAGAHVLYQR